MLPVTVVALESASPSSVAITLDVLTVANHYCREAGRPPAFDVALHGSGAVLFRPFLRGPEAAHGAPELVIVPGQFFSRTSNYRQRLRSPDAIEALEFLHSAVKTGAHVAGSCSGTLLMAAGGCLDGKRATTAWWLAPLFTELFPAVRLDTAALIVRDGECTTAGAAMAQMDLMVSLVARYAGATVADQCARRLVLDERRSQLPYLAVGLLAASSDSVAAAAAWARARLHEKIGVNDLARAVGQSPRTFARRVTGATGLSPIQFLQQIRVERAVELLETSTLPFEEIAYRVGYSEPSTLRMLIRRGLGFGPRAVRARARATPGVSYAIPGNQNAFAPRAA